MAVDYSRYCYREVLPFTVIIVMECTNVGLNTLFKLATNHGMSRHVFIVYAYAIAALSLFPFPFFSVKFSHFLYLIYKYIHNFAFLIKGFSFVLYRSRALPTLSFSILIKIFFLGVVGYTSQIMGYTGIKYGSPTLASAMSNLAPAFTFVLAVIFRMEKVALSSTSSRAKIIGTIVSISGAFVVTFYKGPSIKPASAEHLVKQSLRSPQSDWMIGSMFLAVEYTLVPVWYIIQTHIMKVYPAELTIVFFYTLCVSVLGAIVGFFAETDSSKWTISPHVALASILCSGVFGCCINNAIHTWALHLRGPVYVAMFKPLSIAIAAGMGVIILGDNLYLGSIIGATIIVIGFYTVMWGKAKEDWVELDEISDLETAIPEKHPLLQNHRNQLSQGK